MSARTSRVLNLWIRASKTRHGGSWRSVSEGERHRPNRDTPDDGRPRSRTCLVAPPPSEVLRLFSKTHRLAIQPRHRWFSTRALQRSRSKFTAPPQPPNPKSRPSSKRLQYMRPRFLVGHRMLLSFPSMARRKPPRN